MTSDDTEKTQGLFWENCATQDPLWAVLSDPAERGRKWDLARFFETGRREISVLLPTMERLGISLSLGNALDFGCGVGRLTQALADHFETATGVDVSPTMLAIASKLNRHNDRVKYILNTGDDLSSFADGSLDFVYSNIVLQHIPPHLTVSYLKEFVRVLRAGGAAVFQLPSHERPQSDQRAPTPLDPRDYRATLRVDEGGPISVNPSDARTVVCAVRHAGVTPWVAAESGTIRLGNHWLSADGAAMLIQDDGRTALPPTVTPGESLAVSIQVTAPPKPGRYICEFDLVHEGVVWFQDRGSLPVRIAFDVGQPTASSISTFTEKPEPWSYPDIYKDLPPLQDHFAEFPMHGVPIADVTDVLTAAGAEILCAEVDEHSGPEWVGYRYFVRKRT